MIELSFALAQDSEDEPEEPEALGGVLPELGPEFQAWQEADFARYKRTRSAASGTESLSVNHTTLPTAAPVGMVFSLDETFFNQIVLVYLYYGWPAIRSVLLRASDKTVSLTLPARQLVRTTAESLCKRIVSELKVVENEATSIADRQWHQTLASLKSWKSDFKAISKSRYAFVSTTKARSILAQFKKYHEAQRAIQRSIDERTKVNKGGKYRPGENDGEHQDLYRTWGANELRLRAEMQALAYAIGQECPAALFALQDSKSVFSHPDTTSYRGYTLAHSYAESDVATKIVAEIQRAADAIADFIRSLARTASTEAIDATKALAEGPEATIAKLCLGSLSRGSLLTDVVNHELSIGDVLSGDVSAHIRTTVMSASTILALHGRERFANAGTSFKRVVSLHYQHALDAECTRKVEGDKQLDLWLTRIRYIASVVAVVAVIAAIVVSDGTLMPAGVMLIGNLIQTADHVLNLAILAMVALESVYKDHQMLEEWQLLVRELNTGDLATISAVAEAAQRLYDSRVTITQEMIKLMITAYGIRFNAAVLSAYGIGHKLNLIARAVEVNGLADDLDTLVVDANLVFSGAGS